MVESKKKIGNNREKIQLGVPKITKFAQGLVEKGLNLPNLPITITEFKEILHG